MEYQLSSILNETPAVMLFTGKKHEICAYGKFIESVMYAEFIQKNLKLHVFSVLKNWSLNA